MKLSVDNYALMSGAPIRHGEFIVYPPTLADIRDVGYENYQSYISLFLLSQSDIFSLIGVPEAEQTLQSFSPIQLITIIPDLRATLLRSLRFFLHQEVCYTDALGFFLDLNSRVYLSLNQILDLRAVILKLCCIEDKTIQETVSFQSERARKTYEKIQKHKSKKKQNSRVNDADMELSNLVGAVAAYSPTYNLLNIWGLTVFQFYDQFERLSGKIQLDVIGQKWAAWGTEDFDFSVWFKSHKS